MLDAVRPGDPWIYTSYSFVSHLSPHSGCCNARLGPLVLHCHTHLSPTCLPFVSHILDALTPVWDPWFYSSFPKAALAEGFLICLIEKGSLTLIWISHGTTLKTATHLSPTCLPFVSHILDALTPVWDPWVYSSYSFVSHLSPTCLPHSGCSNTRLRPLVLHVILICLPLVSHLSGTFWMLYRPSFYTSYPLVSHLSPICIPHSGCSSARLGPLILHVILICLPLVSHLSPTFWML